MAGMTDPAQLAAACPVQAAACTISAVCTGELTTNIQTAMMAIFTGQTPSGSPEFVALMTCVVTNMRSGDGRPTDDGGGGGGGNTWQPEDPSTESGRECLDGVDNDADGTVDCADPDCAAVAQICGDPTCFVVGKRTPQPPPQLDFQQGRA